uniref:Uncharacterized protein n=1 Tax=Arundo donax TaxID=35708 RepID=A0A0A9BJK8_ARUDO
MNLFVCLYLNLPVFIDYGFDVT